MALATIGRVLWPDPIKLAQCTQTQNLLLNASGQRGGYVFQVPMSGTITKLGVRMGTVTSGNGRLGLYTVDGSGNPTSTAYGGSAYGTFTPTGSTYSEVTLGTPATATMGDFAAWVCEADSGTPNYNILYGSTLTVGYLPYINKYDGTSTWTRTNGYPIYGHLYYSDSGGQWPDVTMLPSTATNLTTAASPTQVALKVTVPVKCRVIGIWHMTQGAAGGDFEVGLYSGTSAVASASVDGDLIGATVGQPRYSYFTSSVTVNAGDTVYASVKATTATSITHRYITLYAAGTEQAFGLPQGACYSTRSGGSWTDTTSRLPLTGLIIDQFGTDAGAAGVKIPRGMTGGYSS